MCTRHVLAVIFLVQPKAVNVQTIRYGPNFFTILIHKIIITHIMHVFVTTTESCSYKNVHMCNYNFMDQECKEIWNTLHSLNVHNVVIM